MQHFANELLEEAPVGVSSTTALVLVSIVSRGLGSLTLGLVLISPGCGLPT